MNADGSSSLTYGSIIEVGNLLVGHAQDYNAITGCTVIRFIEPAVCGVDVRGSASGSRELDCLNPLHIVPAIHALLFTGGSAYGLAAADGVVTYLEQQGIGFPIGRGVVPIVPGGVVFDLNIGEFNRRPDAAMGREATIQAGANPHWGSVGAGTGASVGKLMGFEHATKGGLGTACVTVAEQLKVGALAVVNAFGNVVDPTSGAVVAGVRRADNAGFVSADAWLQQPPKSPPRLSFAANTTLVLVAVNAKLTKVQATKLAQAAHDGLAMTIQPVHTMLDGDMVFAASCGSVIADINLCCFAAVRAVSAAILHAVESATGLGGVPAAREIFR